MSTKSFLDKWTELETLLKVNGLTILEYENNLNDGSMEKESLKVCRIMRNFVVHNNRDLLVFSDNQEKFLDYLIKVIKENYAESISEILTKTKPIVAGTVSISDLLTKFKKVNLIPICDKKGTIISIFSKRSILGALLDGYSLSKKLTRDTFIKHSELFSTVDLSKQDVHLYLLTKGEIIAVFKNNKYLGLYQK